MKNKMILIFLVVLSGACVGLPNEITINVIPIGYSISADDPQNDAGKCYDGKLDVKSTYPEADIVHVESSSKDKIVAIKVRTAGGMASNSSWKIYIDLGSHRRDGDCIISYSPSNIQSSSFKCADHKVSFSSMSISGSGGDSHLLITPKKDFDGIFFVKDFKMEFKDNTLETDVPIEMISKIYKLASDTNPATTFRLRIESTEGRYLDHDNAPETCSSVNIRDMFYHGR